jgi:hypothetical protein
MSSLSHSTLRPIHRTADHPTTDHPTTDHPTTDHPTTTKTTTDKGTNHSTIAREEEGHG